MTSVLDWRAPAAEAAGASAPSLLPRPAVSTAAVVVLPTYNEADNIVPILMRIMAADPSVHVAVIDDSSPDGTADRAQEAATLHPGRIHVVRRGGKDGLGAAYRHGFRWAAERGYEVIVQMDADGSHPPEALPGMLQILAAGGTDLVVGSRYVTGGATVGWPWRRHLLSKTANAYARLVLGLRLRDTTGAFRAWKAPSLFSVDPWDTTIAGYGFLVEMVTAAERRGLRIAEVPITFTERRAGVSKMDSGVASEAARRLWALRRAGLRWSKPDRGARELAAARS